MRAAKSVQRSPLCEIYRPTGVDGQAFLPGWRSTRRCSSNTTSRSGGIYVKEIVFEGESQLRQLLSFILDTRGSSHFLAFLNFPVCRVHLPMWAIRREEFSLGGNTFWTPLGDYQSCCLLMLSVYMHGQEDQPHDVTLPRRRFYAMLQIRFVSLSPLYPA